MSEPTLLLPDAEQLRNQLRELWEEIDNDEFSGPSQLLVIGYCRARVESDLAGLRRHQPLHVLGGVFCSRCGTWPCPDYRDRSDDLHAIAGLYGVGA